MKNLVWVLLIALGAISFSSCDSGGYKTNSNSGNTNVETNTDVKTEKSLNESVAARELEFYEAWKKKDGKFFEENLSDDFVGVGSDGMGDKAGAVKSITDFPCEVKSVAAVDTNVLKLTDDVVLYTGKSTSEVLCKEKPLPSPNWAATVYVKKGDKWMAAYHQTVQASDAKGEAPASPAEAADKKSPEDSNKELTATLSAIDKKLWEAWIKKDGKAFDEALTKDHISLDSEGRVNKETEVKKISEHKCEIKSNSQEDFRTMKISDTVALLTYKAKLDGTCDGKAVPKVQWTATIFVKDGDKWSPTFHMSTPGP